MNSYVYALIDPRNNEIRYIGKTIRTIKQRLHEHLIDTKNNWKSNWVQSLLRINLKPQIRVIQVVNDEELLCNAEIFWIAFYKHFYKLTNMTRGGEGGAAFGHVVKEETKQLISNKFKQRWANQEYRKKMLDSLRINRKPMSEEGRENISKAQLGKKRKPHSVETKEKMRLKALGRKVSEETKKKISETVKKTCNTEEHKEFLRQEAIKCWANEEYRKNNAASRTKFQQ